MALTPEQKKEIERKLGEKRDSKPRSSSPGEEAASKTKADLSRPQPGLFTRIIEAPGKAIEKGANVIGAIATEIERPFLRTAATGVSALRGAWNLATGNIEAEQVAQAKDDQRGGVDLGPLGVQRPVQQAPGGGTQTLPKQLADMVGTGTQIASTIAAPGLARFGAASGAPQAVAQGFTGGVTALLHGAGREIESSVTEEKGALEAVADVASGTAVEGALGTAAGAGFGALEDWWTAPVKAAVPEAKVLQGQTAQPSAQLPNDVVKREVIEKAREADASLDDVLSVDIGDRNLGPGAAGAKSAAFSPQSASKSAQELIDSGMNPNRLREIADMDADDLRALQKAVVNGKRVTRVPGDKSKIRLAEGLADNVESNIAAIDDVTAPYAKGISDAVRNADQSLFDENAFSAKVAEALPSRTIKLTSADRKFVESLIDEFDQIKTLEDAHEFRQKIASMTDQFAAPLRAAGAQPTQGEAVAEAMRQKMGEYLDEVLETLPVNVDGRMMTYGELRRRIAPLLGAEDEFWKAVGGKWQGYDAADRNRRLGEIAGRLGTNASANTDAAFNNLKSALKAEGIEVGGDLGKQASYVKFIEDLYSAGPDRAIQQAFQQGSINASDVEGAVRRPVGTAITYGIEKGLNLLGISGERAREKATEKVRRAFANYVMALLRSKGG